LKFLRSWQRLALHLHGKAAHRNLLAQVQHVIEILHISTSVAISTTLRSTDDTNVLISSRR